MELLNTPEAHIKLSQARRLMKEALEILERLGDIGDVGPHLDAALCRLEDHLGVNAPGTGGMQELRTALERELRASSKQSAAMSWKPNRFDAVR